MLICFVASCDVTGQRITGSGNVVKENRDNVPSFNEISVSGSMDVYVSKGATQSITIEGDDNIIPYVELEVKGSDLNIGMRRNYNYNFRKSLKIYITVPEVVGVSLTGSGDLKMEDEFSVTRDVKVSLTGSGNLYARFKAPNVGARLTGSGDLYIAGETRDFNIVITGSGDVDGDNLMSEATKVSISGSGDASVHASVDLDVKISGSGDVTYKGSPNVNSKISGSGSVRKN